MKYISEDGSVINLSTKDTDMLVITFKNNDETQLTEIRLRGAESDVVIKKVKNRL